MGDNKVTPAVTARILRLIPGHDSVIFSEYTRLAQTEDVLRFCLPDDSRAAESWLRFLVEAGRIDDAHRTWEWVAERGDADDNVNASMSSFSTGKVGPTWQHMLGVATYAQIA